MIAALILLSALTAHGAQPASQSELSQDITVHARAATVGIQVAAPAASKPVIDEVLRSLSLGRGSRAAVHITAGGDESRLSRPFPESPFLALSPTNIAALYDEWTFEVLDQNEKIIWKTEGVGVLKERIEWSGDESDGRLAIITGESYRYRFTGRRAGREFVIDSDLAILRSFTHREYAGETRLEADIDAFFEEGKASFTKEAGQWIDALAGRLRLGDARADGSYKVELNMRDVRSKLAAARAQALSKRLAAALFVKKERVPVLVASH
jgi:hypothetical protein